MKGVGTKEGRAHGWAHGRGSRGALARRAGRLRCYGHRYLLPTPSGFDAHEIAPRVYLGSVWAAYNVTELRRKGVSHVLAAASGVFGAYPERFEYLCLDLRDAPEQKLLDVFETSNRFIDSGSGWRRGARALHAGRRAVRPWPRPTPGSEGLTADAVAPSEGESRRQRDAFHACPQRPLLPVRGRSCTQPWIRGAAATLRRGLRCKAG